MSQAVSLSYYAGFQALAEQIQTNQNQLENSNNRNKINIDRKPTEACLFNLIIFLSSRQNDSKSGFFLAYDPMHGRLLRLNAGSSSDEVEELSLRRAPLNPTAFHRILPNNAGQSPSLLLALIGQRCVSIAILPTLSSSSTTCRTVHLSERYFATNNDVRVLDVHWLPLRCFGDQARLAVLASDQQLRIYDIATTSNSGNAVGGEVLPILELNLSPTAAAAQATSTISIDKPISFVFTSPTSAKNDLEALLPAADAEKLPLQTSGAYEILILSEQGGIRVGQFQLHALLSSRRTSNNNTRSLKTFPLAVYPASDELYGLYASSIRVLSYLSTTTRLVLAIGMQSGRVYHALVERLPRDETDEEFDLRDDDDDDSQNDDDNNDDQYGETDELKLFYRRYRRNSYGVFLIDSIDLDLSSSATRDNDEEDNLPLDLITFPSMHSDGCYMVRSVLGIHTVRLTWFSSISSSSTANNSKGLHQNLPKSTVEYTCCWDERRTPSRSVVIMASPLPTKLAAAVDDAVDTTAKRLYELCVSFEQNDAVTINNTMKVLLPWLAMPTNKAINAEKSSSLDETMTRKPATTTDARRQPQNTPASSSTELAIDQILSNRPSMPSFNLNVRESNVANQKEEALHKFITAAVDNLTIWAGQLDRARELALQKLERCRLNEQKFAQHVAAQLQQQTKLKELDAVFNNFTQFEQQTFQPMKRQFTQRVLRIDSASNHGRLQQQQYDTGAGGGSGEVQHVERLALLRQQMQSVVERLMQVEKKLEYQELRGGGGGDVENDVAESNAVADDEDKSENSGVVNVATQLVQSNRRDLNILLTMIKQFQEQSLDDET